MADEKTPNSITLSFGDPKVWAVIFTLIGGQFAANKLSLNGVENQQQKVSETANRAVEKQESIDDRLRDLKGTQDQMLGEMRYRLDAVEKRMRELPDSIENTKGKR